MEQSDFLCITVMTTGACNFRCSYCFESHEHPSLSSESISNICSIVSEYKRDHNELKRLIVIWFGGEPTLSIEYIVELSQSLKKIAQKESIDYSSRIITNGYHLDRIIPLIEDLNLTDIQVTLDGMPDTHDSRRMHASGKKTFNKIIENLLQIETRIDLVIRVNVDSENINQIRELFLMVKQLPFSPEVRVFFQPMLVEDYGGESSCYLGRITNDRALYLEYLELQKDIGILEKPVFLGAFCNVDFPGALVVTSDGKIVKCWADINDREKNDIKVYDSNVSQRIRKFYGSVFDLRYERCEACVIFPACLGGCKYIDYTEEQCEIKRELMILQAQKYLEDTISKG